MAKPVHAVDVAAYILREAGAMTTWKLQKLCYYAQAWSLVWDEEPIFTDKIEAWAGGPVVPTLYSWHRGRFNVAAAPPGGNADKLDVDQRETVDAVLEGYWKLKRHATEPIDSRGGSLARRSPTWRVCCQGSAATHRYRWTAWQSSTAGSTATSERYQEEAQEKPQATT